MEYDESIGPRTRRFTALAGLLVLAGCGDSQAVDEGFPEGIGPHVLLQRNSTGCALPASAPLTSEMGPGIEFPVDRTKALSTPCDDSASPEIEIDVGAQSVIFDFANVLAPGEFSAAQFDGYVLHFERGCGDAALASASWDATGSSPELATVELRTHLDRLSVNFAGARYDASSFLKIDLVWASIRCLRGPLGAQD